MTSVFRERCKDILLPKIFAYFRSSFCDKNVILIKRIGEGGKTNLMINKNPSAYGKKAHMVIRPVLFTVVICSCKVWCNRLKNKTS